MRSLVCCFGIAELTGHRTLGERVHVLLVANKLAGSSGDCFDLDTFSSLKLRSGLLRYHDGGAVGF